MPRRVAIVGAALSDIGRVDDLTPFHLHAQAVRRAVADAGLTKDDVDGFASNGTGTLPPHRGGRVPRAQAHLARLHRGGRRHVGGHGRPRRRRHRHRPGRRGRAVLRLHHPGRPQEEAAHGQPQLRRPRARCSTRCPTATRSSPSTACRPSATCTSTAPPSSSWPRSRCPPATTPGSTPTPTTATPSPSTTCIDGRMIADPFTKLHCCIRSDGGCAIVMVAEDRVADLGDRARCGCWATAST